jgi:hypothetical protein
MYSNYLAASIDVGGTWSSMKVTTLVSLVIYSRCTWLPKQVLQIGEIKKAHFIWQQLFSFHWKWVRSEKLNCKVRTKFSLENPRMTSELNTITQLAFHVIINPIMYTLIALQHTHCLPDEHHEWVLFVCTLVLYIDFTKLIFLCYHCFWWWWNCSLIF